ncbi:hypothetical protein A9Y76_10860 [Ralstonia insidiosa]|jgi:hypothetical protein|uniref:Uncharacterized protein n=2 Tax=Ralstonia TaxID=48736 RepID=A0A191ZXT7_9RALS|nr:MULTISPECIES: hypothetical protein [Ralstonia]ANJ72934.1 hypothetical protein A9Y76_10860 [Ralstonia insidiosa]EPX97124.1 hypothetical protein C404_15025 [Ralstonia sp. AU12-08]MBT2177854.1 hypothetical protein [Ralstonia pickettii]CAJ0723038.1 hypothetical protein R38712_01582 [Ralstonia pickettii]
MTTPLKKDTLIDLFWILDAIQKGQQADRAKVTACFTEVRDALLRPDTEEIVQHIRDVLAQQKQAVGALAMEAAATARRLPLPESELIAMMLELCAPYGIAEQAAAELAVAIGRRVEAALGWNSNR